jgi:hypothetical protein
VIALAVGTLVLVVVPTAAPRPVAGSPSYYKAQAHFNVTIRGTYTGHGVNVNTDCFLPPVNEDTQPQQITVTTTGDETLTFKSTRSVKLDAYKYLNNSVGAGTLGRRTPLAVTTTKTLTLTQPCREGDPEPVCGTKHPHLAMSLISRDKPLRLYYDFSDGPGRVIFPDDPFDFGCRIPALTWWGKLRAPPAPLPAAKLFNPKVKRFTMSAAVAKSPHEKTTTETSDGHYDLRYTITLVRRAS